MRDVAPFGTWLTLFALIIGLITLIAVVTHGLRIMGDDRDFREDCLRKKGYVLRTEDGRRICAKLL